EKKLATDGTRIKHRLFSRDAQSSERSVRVRRAPLRRLRVAAKRISFLSVFDPCSSVANFFSSAYLRARSSASSLTPLRLTFPLPSSGSSGTAKKSRSDGSHRFGSPRPLSSLHHGRTSRPYWPSVTATYRTTSRSPRAS